MDGDRLVFIKDSTVLCAKYIWFFIECFYLESSFKVYVYTVVLTNYSYEFHSFDVVTCIRIFPLQFLHPLFFKRKQFCGNSDILTTRKCHFDYVSVLLFVDPSFEIYFTFFVSTFSTQSANIVL